MSLYIFTEAAGRETTIKHRWKELLDTYSDNVDKDIYILGGSMGGAGTLSMIALAPVNYSKPKSL